MANEVLIITAVGPAGSEQRTSADNNLKIFEEAAGLAGMSAIRIDNLDCEVITPLLWEKLRTSRIAIADLSFPNVNAAYEVGVRHGLQMPTLIVTNDTSGLPFDFKDYNTLELLHDGKDARRIARRLVRPAREIQNAVFRDWKFRVIPPPDNPAELNVHFYDTVVEALRSSRSDVLLTGSGFDDDSRLLHEYLRVSVDFALEKELTRIDISTPQEMPLWWKLVVTYLLPMKNFCLFVPQGPNRFLVDLALFDWNTEDALVEVMFHTDAEISSVAQIRQEKIKRAGYSLFAHSHQLARDLFKLMSDLRKEGHLVRLRSKADIREHFKLPEDWGKAAQPESEEEDFYFAYGPSMLPAQMNYLAPSSKKVCVAFSPGWRLATTLGNAMFSSATVTIVSAGGAVGQVFGILYKLKISDLKRLDFFEGVEMPKPLYKRERVTVIDCDSNDKIEAWTYTASESPGEFPLSENYLGRILRGASHANLPEDYIEKTLRRLGALQ